MNGTAVQVTQYRKLENRNLVTCHPSIERSDAVSSNGVLMRTLNGNAKLTAMGDLPDERLGNCNAIVQKGMDIHLSKEY